MLAIIHFLAQASPDLPGVAAVVACGGAGAVNIAFWIRLEHRLTKLETMMDERKTKR